MSTVALDAGGNRRWRAALFRAAVRLGDRVMDAARFRRDAPDPEHVLATVADEPGRAAIERWQVREALDAWLASLREEADLNAIGRIGAHWDAVRLLRTLCRFEEEEARDPAILDEPIEAPIFIMGLPRSGTTFLHTLMSRDPVHRVPLCWEAMAPYPPRRGADRRRADAARQLGAFLDLAPGLASLHPLAPDTPQECTELFSPVFRSLRFDATHRVPGYRRWLDRAGHLPAYRFHRRFLQHLQHQSGAGRWVLKSPDHVFTLDALRAVYPDARIVFVHRDPLKVLPSTSRLTELLRAPFTRSVDPDAVAQHVTRDWHEGSLRMIAEAERDARIVHVHFGGLRSDPLETVAGIYRELGLPFTDAARDAIADEIRRRPRGGYGRNTYRFEEHGIDPAAERQRFRPYTDAFGVALEVSA